MIYLERIPAAPLDDSVRLLWYTRIADAPAGRERILPDGCVQVIVNLARDLIWDCGEFGRRRALPGSLIVGSRSVYEIVDRSDMAELMGIVFRPAGFAAFAGDAVDLFSNRHVPLEDAWGARARRLRERLHEAVTPAAKLRALEVFLANEFGPRPASHPMVDFALSHIARAPRMSSVSEMAAQTGWSVRRFSQVFRERVGLSPKAWCRLQRFQRALRQVHAGADVAWAELAVECGYYDQAHFANEFRAFSGIDVTTYSARRTQWVNHVIV